MKFSDGIAKIRILLATMIDNVASIWCRESLYSVCICSLVIKSTVVGIQINKAFWCNGV